VQIEGGGGAAAGAAMLAAVSVKIFPDPHTAAKRWVRFGKRFLPDPVKATYYQQRAVRYNALLQALNHWATRPLSSI